MPGSSLALHCTSLHFAALQDTVSIVLFNVVPQLLDIGVACAYLAITMQPWAAAIVFVTVRCCTCTAPHHARCSAATYHPWQSRAAGAAGA